MRIDKPTPLIDIIVMPWQLFTKAFWYNLVYWKNEDGKRECTKLSVIFSPFYLATLVFIWLLLLVVSIILLPIFLIGSIHLSEESRPKHGEVPPANYPPPEFSVRHTDVNSDFVERD